MEKFNFLSGTLQEAQDALNLAFRSDDYYSMVGLHPLKANDPYKNLKPDASEKEKDRALNEYFEQMREMFEEKLTKICCVGECGLDYHRLHVVDRET